MIVEEFEGCNQAWLRKMAVKIASRLEVNSEERTRIIVVKEFIHSSKNCNNNENITFFHLILIIIIILI